MSGTGSRGQRGKDSVGKRSGGGAADFQRPQGRHLSFMVFVCPEYNLLFSVWGWGILSGWALLEEAVRSRPLSHMRELRIQPSVFSVLTFRA